jgi:hypothetical protein
LTEVFANCTAQTSARLDRATAAHRLPPLSRAVTRPFALTTMARRKIIRVVSIFGLALFASTPAFDADVAGMTCSEIASFAQEVAQQKAEGSYSQ